MTLCTIVMTKYLLMLSIFFLPACQISVESFLHFISGVELDETTYEIEKINNEINNVPSNISYPSKSETINNLSFTIRPDKAYYKPLKKKYDNYEKINIKIFIGFKNRGKVPMLFDTILAPQNVENTNLGGGILCKIGDNNKNLKFMNIKGHFRDFDSSISPHDRLTLIQPDRMWVKSFSLNAFFIGLEEIEHKKVYVQCVYRNYELNQNYFEFKNKFEIWKGKIESNIIEVRFL